ncbi:MAG: acyltransferase family protein [Candidatus Dormibacteria bacterium]
MSDPAPTPTLPGGPGWLPLIEVMRAVAALSVVLHHCYTLADRPLLPLHRYVDLNQLVEGFGEWGVDMFFLLSSFLLAEYFWRTRSKRSFRAFYTRRLFRIAPAYYATVAVLFVFFADHAALFSRSGIRQVAANLTFTQWLLPGTSGSLNVDGALWTLTIEMLLYAVLPLMALLVLWQPVGGTAALVLGGLAYRVAVSLHGGPLVRLYLGSQAAAADQFNIRLYLARQFVGFLPVFAAGILLRWLIVKKRLPRRFLEPLRRPSAAIFFLLLVPSLLVLFNVERASNYQHPLWFAGYDAAVGVLALPALAYASRPVVGALSLALRAGTWLGRRSYGLYLWHFPVVLSVYGRGPLLNPPQLSYWPLRLLVILAVSIALAAASYSLVEKPAMARGAVLARRWTEPRTLAAARA